MTRQPIHTRLLELEVRRGKIGELLVNGTICDLRKQGFVPTGGDLQVSGLIHNMGIQALVDRENRKLLSIEPSQTVVAYEASEVTDGESCRDIGWRLRGMKDKHLDGNFVGKLAGEFGGRLGCTHLLSLTQLLPSTLDRALAWESSLVAGDAPGEASRERGERIFKRSIVFDGYEFSDREEMEVIVQLNDVHTTPQQDVTNALERFARQFEVQLWARVGMPNLQLTSIRGREREREEMPLDRGGWRDLAEDLSALHGCRTLEGLGREVIGLLGGEVTARPLRDALLTIAPGMIQCMAVKVRHMIERGDGEDSEPNSTALLGAQPDSCYIWRADGPGRRRSEARWAAIGAKAREPIGGEESE